MSNVHDQPADVHRVAASAVDFSVLLGTWKNLDPTTSDVVELTLSCDAGRYRLRAVGASTERVDWGSAEARVYAGYDQPHASGFCAGFRLGRVQTHLSANLNQGILVVQCYTSHGGDSGPAARFSKEYFRKPRN